MGTNFLLPPLLGAMLTLIQDCRRVLFAVFTQTELERAQNIQVEVDHTLESVARQISSLSGFTGVQANLPGWSGGVPEAIEGHVPEITAVECRNGQTLPVIWSLLTWDSLTSVEAIERCQAFSRKAQDQRGAFYLVLPPSIEAYAWSWINIHSIAITSFWIVRP